MKVEASARRQIVVVLAVTALTLVVAVGAVVFRKNDPRAYPEHDGSSLSASLKWAHLQLAPCAEESVRYAKIPNMFGVEMWLRISAGRDCIDQFLTLNAFTGPRTTSKGAFVVLAPKGFGWPDSYAKTYTVIRPDFADTEPLQVEIAADLDKDLPDLFIMVGNV